VDFRWLVPFSRMVASATSPAEAQRALVDAAVAHLDVDGAAVFRVEGDQLVIAASAGLPDELATWTVDLGTELASQLLERLGAPFTHARELMLVVDGDLYGMLVLFARAPIELDAERVELAHALVDLTATATARAVSYDTLARSYAELKASREALARSEQLRLLGQMAAGITHDVKNILNPLNLQLELLRRKLTRGDLDAAHQTLDTMAEVIRAGVGVVDRLRAFSRPAVEPESEPVDVAAAVRTAIALVRPRAAQHGAIELIAYTPATAPIRARAAELTSATVNLLVNAIEAMAEHGGTITVTCADVGDEVTIVVADDGPGMSPEAERRVFEPFFTTKGKEGTGLGLAMIYAFVVRHGGRIDLVTAPGAGTTFTLRFPAAR
jgi:signal transduction histidine kinase